RREHAAAFFGKDRLNLDGGHARTPAWTVVARILQATTLVALPPFGRTFASSANLLLRPLLENAPEGASLVRRRVRHDAVDLPSLVVLGKIFGDRKPFVGHEEQAVAVLELLHLIARADPVPSLHLLLARQVEALRPGAVRRFLRVEVAGAQRPPEIVDV